MSEYLMEMLGYNVEGAAEWRRRKAEEFPEDVRNLEAAEQLERLAADIGELNSSIEAEIKDLQERINSEDRDNDAWMELTETVSAELRSIGFHGSYETGISLVEWYRDLLRDKLHDLLDEDQEQEMPKPAPIREPSRAALAAAKEVALTTAEEAASKYPFAGRGFSNRTVNALIAAGVDAPEHLLFMTLGEIHTLPGIGKACLLEINSYRERFRQRIAQGPVIGAYR